MPPFDRLTLEVCVDTAAGIVACQADADRIELCSALALGGLTPGPGLIDCATSSSIPVHVMIRPRAGDFAYDAAEIDLCCAEIAAVRQAGLPGVVFGVARNGSLDLPALRRMCDAAKGLAMTLHRVVDTLDDPVAAVGQAIDLGFNRILSSGGAAAAPDGATRLAAMHDAAAGRIEIMAGSGLTPDNVAGLARQTGIRAFHASCSANRSEDPTAQALGFAGPIRKDTDAHRIAAFRAVLDGIGAG